jgi:hypothetical protein
MKDSKQVHIYPALSLDLISRLESKLNALGFCVYHNDEFDGAGNPSLGIAQGTTNHIEHGAPKESPTHRNGVWGVRTTREILTDPHAPLTDPPSAMRQRKSPRSPIRAEHGAPKRKADSSLRSE